MSVSWYSSTTELHWGLRCFGVFFPSKFDSINISFFLFWGWSSPAVGLFLDQPVNLSSPNLTQPIVGGLKPAQQKSGLETVNTRWK